MPKQKTNRSAAKRFSRTGSGKYKHRRTNRNHILTKKSKERKRDLRGTGIVDKSDQLGIARLLLDR